MTKKQNPIEKTQSATQEITTPKKTRNYRTLAFQSYLLLTITTFITLALFAHFTPYFQIDLLVSQAFQTFNPPYFLDFMKFISFWGYNPQMLIISITILILTFIMGLKLESIIGAINIIGAGLITGILKILISRDRPTSDLVNVVINLSDKSFPSGHVLTYTAFFGYLWFLSFALLKHSLLRSSLLVIFGGLVILVGPSRVYLGEHWSSDVLGGYLIGSVWLLLTIFLYRYFKDHVKKTK